MLSKTLLKNHTRTVLKLLEITKTRDVSRTSGKIEFPPVGLTEFSLPENNVSLILEEMSLTTIEKQE